MKIINKNIKLIGVIVFSVLLQSIIYKTSFSQQVTITSIDVSDVWDCYGGSTGTIIVNATGTFPPLTYSINGGASYQVSNIFTGLPAGTYSNIVVKDNLGNKAFGLAVINQPDAIFIENETHTNVTGCYGDTNGSITITASGGTGTLTYSIDNGVSYFNNGGIFTGIGAGTYSIKVKDSNGCIKSGSNITITEPPQLTYSAPDKTDVITCFGDANGTISINTSGGTAPVLYSIDGGATYQFGNYFTGLAAGTYNLMAKDDNGCTISCGSVTINQPAPLTIDSYTYQNVETCYGESTGSITITASGGTGVISCSIDGGSFFNTSLDFPNLYAGNYSIVLRDANFCTVTGNDITITEPPLLEITSEIAQNITGCFGDLTGEIHINAIGGVSPIYYSIDNGGTYQTNGDFLNLGYGTYQVLIHDNNNCFVTGGSHLLTQPMDIVISDVYKYDVSTCFGDSVGTITVIAYGGTGALEYSVDNGVTWTTNNIIQNLPAGTYTVMVRDQEGCTKTYPTQQVISEPSEIVISDVQLQNPTCFGYTNGSIEIIATGGVGNLFYSVDNGTIWTLNNNINNLGSGTNMQVVVKDANACTVYGNSYTLTDPPELLITNIDAINVQSCSGGSDGSINITVTGGTPPIQYSINSGANYSDTCFFDSLYAGQYQIQVVDTNNCYNVLDTLVILTAPTQLLFKYNTSSNVIGCKGDSTGTITVVSQGGTLPITYYISSGALNLDNSNGNFTGLPAGLYTVNIVDVNGCSVVGNNVLITEPDLLEIDSTVVQNIECNGQLNGRINLIGTGGEAPYRFSINGGATYQFDQAYSNLPAGIYETYIKDNFNCIQPGPILEITEPPLLEITDVQITNIEQCYGDLTGSIIMTVAGGTGAYLHSVNAGVNNSTSPIFNNLPAGSYQLYVEDENLCPFLLDTLVTLTQPPEIIIDSIIKTTIACYGDNNGMISVYAHGGTGNLQFSIDNGVTYSSNNVFQNLLPGTYNVKIQDDNSCIKNYGEVNIYEPDSLQITNIILVNEKCEGSNDGQIGIQYNGGTEPYMFTIDGVNYFGYSLFSDLAPGEYYPAILDNNGCTANFPPVVIEEAISSSLFTADIDSGCSPLQVSFTKLTGGLTYLWEFGDGQTSNVQEPTHTFINQTVAPVNFTVASYSTSELGCKDTSFMEITVMPQPILSVQINPDTVFYPNTTVTIQNTSIAGYTNYLWDFGDGQFSNLENPGTHTYETCGTYNIMTRADNDWCSDSIYSYFTIIAHEPEIAIAMDTTNSCVPYIVNFTNNSIYSNSWLWDFGNGDTTSVQEPQYTYDEPGQYSVSITAFGDCNTITTKDTIVYAWAIPVVNFESSPDSVMPPDQPVHFYNLSLLDGASYYWDFGDSTYSDETEPIHFYTQEGEYDVTLYVTSENMCTDSITFISDVYVYPEAKIYFPNAFSPDGNGKNDVFEPAFPQSIKKYNLKIFNRWGEMIFESNDPAIGWDGKFQGKLSIQDVYVWHVVGMFLNGQPFEMAGNVTLLR